MIINCLPKSDQRQDDASDNGVGDACDTVSDSDGDGLADAQEYVLGTDTLDADSDDDGVTDGEEFDCGADPGDAESMCSKGMPWLILLLEED